MKTVNNFFSRIIEELDKKYFPDVQYYRDDKDCEKVHYQTELFNNGCLTYGKYITALSIACDDSEENIQKITDKYIEL